MRRMRTAILTSEGFEQLPPSNLGCFQRQSTGAAHLRMTTKSPWISDWMRILGDCNFPLLYLPNE